MEDSAALFAELEDIGEAEVRVKLAQAVWSDPRKVALVKDWLCSKDEARTLASSNKRDAREEETLSIARKASELAESANRLASEANSIARLQATAAAAQAVAAWRAARYSMYAAALAATVMLVQNIGALVAWLR